MKKRSFLFAVAAALLILLHPQTALNSGRRAMCLWAASVAPAVFPFLALMPLLTGKDACAAYDALFSRIMRPLLRLPGSAAPAVIIAMLCGSPGGAVAIRRIASQGGMSGSDMRRLSLCVCGVSPAYLILGVGASLYGSTAVGLRLALIQISVQLLMLLLTRDMRLKDAAVPSETEEGASGIGTAVMAALSICGYMMLFGTLGGVLFLYIGRKAGNILLAVLDLPSGLAALGPALHPALTGAAVGFGGLCIAAQNLSALRLGWADYLKGRCFACAACAALCALLPQKHPPMAQSVFAGSGFAYAGALLAVLLLILPTLAELSKNIILNKADRGD